MKFDIKAFTSSFTILTASFSFILFTWCAANGFGAQIVQIFESVHPSGGLSIIENINKPFYAIIPGIIINTIYAALDGFIFSFLLSSLNNLIISQTGKKKS